MDKKTQQQGINSQLAIVMKSGKTAMGFKRVIHSIREGKSKALVLSNNLPVLRKSQLEYLAALAKVKTINFSGTNTDLGTACGKLFRISCLSINEVGDSDILGETKA